MTVTRESSQTRSREGRAAIAAASVIVLALVIALLGPASALAAGLAAITIII
jgi:hypothetical protein